MKTLSPQQQNFVRYYLETSNATKAYELAGYKSAYADRAASRLLQTPLVSQYVDKCRENVQQKTIVNFEWVLEKLKVIVDQSIQSEEYSDTAIKAISEINKMLGHHAPEKKLNVNLNSSLDRIREAQLSYKDF